MPKMTKCRSVQTDASRLGTSGRAVPPSSVSLPAVICVPPIEMDVGKRRDSLDGARVALLESRMESELASLVRRHGGEPVCVPAMREVERDCAAEAGLAIDALSAPGAVVVVATGVG